MILPVIILLAAAAYLPGVGSSTTVGRWAVLALGAAVMLAIMRRPWTLGPGHAWGAALFVWAAVGVFWSVSPLDTIGELWHWIVLAILFVAASQHRRPDWTMSALALGLCVSMPFVLLQLRGVDVVHHTRILETWRSPGLFLNPNVLGEVAACALVWAVASRSWTFVPASLFLVAVTGSRGAVLACLFGLLYWIWHERRSWFLPVIACFIIGVVFSLPWLSGPRLDSIYARLDLWTLAVSNLTWTGRGLETFGTLAPLYEFVHNDFLQLAFELGIGSLLAVPLLAYSLGGRRSIAEGAALASLFGASLVSYPLHHPMGAALLAILAGYACGARDRAHRDERLLGDCGTARSAYESEPLRRPRFGGRMVPV